MFSFFPVLFSTLEIKSIRSAVMNGDALKINCLQKAGSLKQVVGCVWTTTKCSNGGSVEAGVTSHDMELKGEVTTWFHSFWLTKVRHNPNGVDDAYDTAVTEATHRETTRNIKKVRKTFLKG